MVFEGFSEARFPHEEPVEIAGISASKGDTNTHTLTSGRPIELHSQVASTILGLKETSLQHYVHFVDGTRYPLARAGPS
jgi:hypothetical protein